MVQIFGQIRYAYLCDLLQIQTNFVKRYLTRMTKARNIREYIEGTPNFFNQFSKGENFYNFLSAYLGNETLSKSSLLFLIRIAPSGKK